MAERLGDRQRFEAEKVVPGNGPIVWVVDGYDGGRGTVVNGVKTFVDNFGKRLPERGFDFRVIHPFTQWEDGSDYFLRVPIPGCPDQPVALNPWWAGPLLDRLQPQGLFITSVEGPLGLYAALYAQGRGLPYSLAYTTEFDRYYDYLPFQLGPNGKRVIDWFTANFNKAVYSGAERILVTTPHFKRKFAELGFYNTVIWPRGVDTEAWCQDPAAENPYSQYPWYQANPLPILVYFGRMGLDKNLHLFADATLPGFHKVFIGPGPLMDRFSERFGKDHPFIHILGPKFGEDLVNHVRPALALVFLSVTDTFGQVVNEAGAVGVPSIVARDHGPSEVITPGKTGVAIDLDSGDLSAELQAAIGQVAEFDRKQCSATTLARYSLETAVDIFLANLPPIPRSSWQLKGFLERNTASFMRRLPPWLQPPSCR